MNARFEIKLNDITNKNFLVFISTELAKKLNYELTATDKLNWTFRRDNAILDISVGYIKTELREEEDRYDRYRTRKVEVEILIEDVLVIQFSNVDSIETVNSVFNIINKYADLKINEHEDKVKNDELVEMLNDSEAIKEVACDTE